MARTINQHKDITLVDKREPRGGNRKPSRKLTAEDAAIIKMRILMGEYLNRIAADFDVNPARVSEIKSGEKFADVRPAV